MVLGLFCSAGGWWLRHLRRSRVAFAVATHAAVSSTTTAITAATIAITATTIAKVAAAAAAVAAEPQKPA